MWSCRSTATASIDSLIKIGARMATPLLNYLAKLSAPSYLRQVIFAKLSSPRRAKQKCNAGNDRERGVRPLLDRFVEGFDEMIGHLAHRACRVAPLVLRVRKHVASTLDLARLQAACGRRATAARFLMLKNWLHDIALSMQARSGVTPLLFVWFAIGAVIGFNFHFGKNCAGSPDFLAAEGRKFGFTVDVIDPFELNGRPVLSGPIRDALAAGRPEEAATLLGFPWFISGEVIHGDKRGRDLGFPTANLSLDAACALRHGVYAVRVAVGDRLYDGVANFGRRPMFDSGVVLLEVFLFDFAGDLYGKPIDVAFIVLGTSIPGAISAGSIATGTSPVCRRRGVFCSTTPNSTTWSQRRSKDRHSGAEREEPGIHNHRQRLSIPLADVWERAAIGPISGDLVVAGVLFYGGWALFALVSYRIEIASRRERRSLIATITGGANTASDLEDGDALLVLNVGGLDNIAASSFMRLHQFVDRAEELFLANPGDVRLQSAARRA